jgi:hypothetical protein
MYARLLTRYNREEVLVVSRSVVGRDNFRIGGQKVNKWGCLGEPSVRFSVSRESQWLHSSRGAACVKRKKNLARLLGLASELGRGGETIREGGPQGGAGQ